MRRYHGLEIIGTGYDGDLVHGVYYLIYVTHTLRGWERYELHTEPGRTNQSHEPRTSGWLGTTNDVSRHARGAVRVAADARGRMRVRPIAVAELLAAEETGAGESRAYLDGVEDGLAWDLDGYDTIEQAARDDDWDGSTIDAMGQSHCEKQWGVSADDVDAWSQACTDYNRGVRAGVSSPDHHGLKPGQDRSNPAASAESVAEARASVQS